MNALNRSLTVTFSLLALCALGNSTASAQHIAHQPIDPFCLAADIRSQMAIVSAQASVTLAHSHEYKNVREELEQLCQKMDRFEEVLADPFVTKKQTKRLAKAAKRVDKQVDELQEEIEDALEDLHDDRKRAHRHPHQVNYAPRIAPPYLSAQPTPTLVPRFAPALSPTLAPTLAPSIESLPPMEPTIEPLPAPPAAYVPPLEYAPVQQLPPPLITAPRRSSLRISVINGSPRVSIVRNAVPNRAHQMVHHVARHHHEREQLASPEVEALRQQANVLRQLSQTLRNGLHN